MDSSSITYTQHNIEPRGFFIFCYYYLFDSISQDCGFILLPHFADSLVGGSENTVSDMFIYVPNLGRHCDKQQGCIFFKQTFCVACQLLIMRWLSLLHF